LAGLEFVDARVGGFGPATGNNASANEEIEIAVAVDVSKRDRPWTRGVRRNYVFGFVRGERELADGCADIGETIFVIRGADQQAHLAVVFTTDDAGLIAHGRLGEGRGFQVNEA